VSKSGVNVFLTKGTLDALGLDQYSGNYNLVEYHTEYTIGSFIVYPFKTHHDAAQSAGYILYSKKLQEKLLFVTDTNYLDYLFFGLNYIMIEANYSQALLDENVQCGYLNKILADRISCNHMELEDTKQYLLETNLKDVKEIHLLHLSRNNAEPDVFVQEVQELTGIPTFTKEWD